jgi:hypothetical protein
VFLSLVALAAVLLVAGVEFTASALLLDDTEVLVPLSL